MIYKVLVTVLVTTAAILLIANYEIMPYTSPTPSPAALDLNCDFTNHFSSFLKENGKALLLQGMKDETSSETTWSVHVLEGEQVKMIR